MGNDDNDDDDDDNDDDEVNLKDSPKLLERELTLELGSCFWQSPDDEKEEEADDGDEEEEEYGDVDEDGDDDDDKAGDEDDDEKSRNLQMASAVGFPVGFPRGK